MADLQPIQQSFESGEITDRLLSRSGTERYQTGLDICENFLPLSHGPAVLRNGFEHIGSIGPEATTGGVRVFALDVNLRQTFVVTVNSSFVKVWNRDGEVAQAVRGINYVSNGHFDTGLLTWKPEVSSSEGAQITWLPQSDSVQMDVVQANATAKLGQPVQIDNPGQTHELTAFVIRSPDTPEVNRVILKAGPSFDTDNYGQITTGSDGPAVLTFSPSLASFWITIEVTAVGQDDVQRWFIDDVQVRNVQGAISPAQFTSPWSAFDRRVLSVASHPQVNSLIFTHPNVPPHELNVDANNNWTFGQISFTSTPGVWTTNNYPRAVAFFQQRLWLGGTPQQPTRFWGSKSNDYFDLTSGSLADDALDYTIGKKGAITWMSGAKNLVIGTEFGESIVTSEGGIVKPGDIDVQPQSQYGSFLGQTEEIGERVLYVSAAERKVRAMGYEWQRDAWVSIDLTWPSEDITIDRIVELEFQREPEQLLWMNNSVNGDLLVCSYNREQNIIGWSKHPHQGRVQSLAVANLNGLSELWALIEYDFPGGGSSVYLERYNEFQYLDSFKLAVAPDGVPTTSFAGFDHLEGFEVTVITDGALHPTKVVSEGLIELDYPALTVVAGHAYQGRMVTLPMEGGSRAGTQQGVVKRYNRVFVRLIASIMPRINGSRPPERDPQTRMDFRQPSATEDVEVSTVGWDRLAQIEILQDVPFETRISGIFGELQANRR